jgi:hypothetical protein
METTAHSEHHHEMPTSGSALTAVAFSATLHCLTGCAIGEVAGMAIGTALGFSDFATIALAVALAFLFGYTLTSLPLLRAGLAFGAVVPIAFASDTLSIAVMEIVDNGIMLVVPGAMEAGIGDVLFWGSLSVALVIAGAVALPVNRWLLARGKGHTAVHDTGIHGGPPVRVVAVVAAIAGVFGTVVLTAEAIDSEGGHGERHEQTARKTGEEQQSVRGLTASADGMTLALGTSRLPRGRQAELQFRVLGADGNPVRGYEVEHEKRMHVIVARLDLTGFQHLHPELRDDGTWRVSMTVPEGGEYRVFADFKREGRNQTLATDLAVDGSAEPRQLPPPVASARTSGGYKVQLDGEAAVGRESELRFTIHRDGKPVTVEPYLGAGGHLVALREGDLAYLHVHPAGHEPREAEHAEGPGSPVSFATEFPSEARYRLFLQFKHEGKVHTAAFTQAVRASGDSSSQETREGGGQDAH